MHPRKPDSVLLGGYVSKIDHGALGYIRRPGEDGDAVLLSAM